MKCKIAALTLLAFIVVGAQPAFAADATAYGGYTYNFRGEQQPSPNIYEPVLSVYGTSVTQTPFSSPSDICEYNNELYVLDSLNSRAVVLDKELAKAREITFSDESGAPLLLQQPQGMFVNKNGILISDTAALQVYRFDFSGRLQQSFSAPDSPLYDKSIPFKVSRVLADSAQNVYALVEGQFSGAVMFSPQGEFLGFYGPNEVEMTLEMMLDQSWKQILSEEQKSAMSRFIPVAYTSFDIDNENFVYTCSLNALSVYSRVRKLNPSGKGLWDDKKILIGDDFPEEQTVKGLANTTQITDVEISAFGFLYALDTAKQRIFQYDENGVLLGVFGSKGQQLGTFQDAAAVESCGDNVYVLDKKQNSITMLKPTAYGEALQKAFTAYNKGEYIKAEGLWREVLALNCTSQPACLGLGKALYAKGEINEALKYLKAGESREQYSLVYENYRLKIMRDNFGLIAGLAVIAAAAYILLKKKRFFGITKYLQPVTRHLRVMKNPVNGMRCLIEKNAFSPLFAVITLGAWLVLDIIEWFATGFIFNKNNPAAFNLLFSVVGTVLAYVLFVIVNWSVSTLSDGKGSAKNLFSCVAYALLPYLLGKGAVLVLSRFLTLQEGTFLVWIQAAAFGWSVLVLFCVLTSLHHYSIGKTCVSILLTLAGMAIVIFLLFMAVVLFEHVTNLANIIYNEIMLRR